MLIHLLLAALLASADLPGWRAKYRRALPFRVVRTAARSLGFSRREWDEWVADGNAAPSLGPYMPSDPEQMYPDEWLGWDDWLGCMRDFADAKLQVRQLSIRSQEEWWDFCSTSPDLLVELRVPARPHDYYQQTAGGQAWLGYDDWLGRNSTVLYAPPPDDYDDCYPGATG
ncbi:hypothetical protein T492DRAFT_1089071 [Pavlovales sp. CCMP2436]|nr:hypothetical protein T492DRAFT_1089071 [Pavlovales sp. CCMP2436]